MDMSGNVYTARVANSVLFLSKFSRLALYGLLYLLGMCQLSTRYKFKVSKGARDLPTNYECNVLNPISSVSYGLQHLQGYRVLCTRYVVVCVHVIVAAFVLW